jgi:hypothetical protein
MSVMIIFVAIDAIILTLMLISKQVHQQWIANLCGFGISSVAACAIWFAIQIPFMKIGGLSNALTFWFMLGCQPNNRLRMRLRL